MKKICLLILVLGLVLLYSQAYSVEIVADATGYDAGYVTDFWGVKFISGSGYIQSVTFDLSTTGGYFDFDGSPFLIPLIPGVEPVLGVMNGLSSSDITYPTNGGNPVGTPTVLTFTFSTGSFTEGDWFRFSADVDGRGRAGGDFGSIGTLFEVTMSDGNIYSVPFMTINTNSSEANIETDSVPEPSTFMLLIGGLAGVGLLRRRFKN